MGPSLREIFTPLIAYMLMFARTPAEQQRPFSQIRAAIEGLIDQQKTALKRQDLSQERYDNACFAVIAWVDELVLRCAHQANQALYDEWRRLPLQVALYKTANAGEEFYDRLARLGPDQKDTAELYFLALSLGFRGRYYDEAQENRLVELRHEFAGRLLSPFSDLFEFQRRQERLTPQPYAVKPPIPKPVKHGLSPFWLAVPVAAAAALLVYFFLPRGPNLRDIEDVLDSFQCADIKLEGVNRGVVTLSGHVESDEDRDLVRHKLEALRGVKAVNEDLGVIPRPFCAVMEVLTPLKELSDKGGEDIQVRPSKGCNATYYNGENLEVDVTGKKPLNYVYLDYYVADRQMVAHLFPNPDQASNALGTAQSLTVGGPNNKAQWRIQPPFGREMVTVMSSPKQLFTPPRLDPETAEDYLASLRQVLRAGAPDAGMAATYCFTTSSER